MKRLRLAELLVGHALAEGTSVGKALQAAGGRDASRASAAVDAGRLEEGMVLAGLHADQSRLGAVWPAAVQGVQRRLDRVPASAVRRAELLQILAYLFLIAGVQALVLAADPGGGLDQLLDQTGQPRGLLRASAGWMFGGLVILEVVLAAAAGLVSLAPHRVPVWRRHAERLRAAAVAAALVDTQAPADVLRAFAPAEGVAGAGELATADLDAVFEAALVRETEAHKRMVAALRVVGLGTLAVVAALITASLYGDLSRVLL